MCWSRQCVGTHPVKAADVAADSAAGDVMGRLRSGLLPTGGLPVPAQELIDAPGRMILQIRQNVGEPGLWVDVIELGGFNEGVDGGGAPAAFVGAGEGPVMTLDRDAAQRPFGGVVRHASAARHDRVVAVIPFNFIVKKFPNDGIPHAERAEGSA